MSSKEDGEKAESPERQSQTNSPNSPPPENDKTDADEIEEKHDVDGEFTIQLDDEDETVPDGDEGELKQGSTDKESTDNRKQNGEKEEPEASVEKEVAALNETRDNKSPTPEINDKIVGHLAEEHTVTKKQDKEEHDEPLPKPMIADPPPVPEKAIGEVVEEVPLSVKEQIAQFSQLKLQETHGKPKPGVASAFMPKSYSPESAITDKPAYKPEMVPLISSDKSLLKNTQPTPFYAAQPSPVPKAATSAQAVFETSALANWKPPEPEPGKPQQYSSGTKWTPKLTATSHPVPVAQTQFGRSFVDPYSARATSSTEIGKKNASISSVRLEPSQYLGSDIISTSTGPSIQVRLRRNGPEINWGFAVFGGMDYGCPPFISRVSHLSNAGQAGLEVGDIIVSICNVPVQGKNHAQIKAEILRAGNELDFMIIKQGIDKSMVTERAPQLFRSDSSGSQPRYPTESSITANSTSATFAPASGVTYPRRPTSSYDGVSGGYRPVRTKSLKLLDEHLASMSARSNQGTDGTVRVYANPTYTSRPAGQIQQDCYTTSTVIRANQNYGVPQSPTRYSSFQIAPSVSYSPYQQPSFIQPQQYSQAQTQSDVYSPRSFYNATPRQKSGLARSTGQYITSSVQPSSSQRSVMPTYSAHRQVEPTWSNTLPARQSTYYEDDSSAQYFGTTTRQMNSSLQQQTCSSHVNWNDQSYAKPTYYSSNTDPFNQEPERWNRMGSVQTSNSGWM